VASTRYSFTSSRLCTNQASFSFFRPACTAHTVALLLHGYARIYDPPSTFLLYATHHTILVITISCKGQVCEWVDTRRVNSYTRKWQSGYVSLHVEYAERGKQHGILFIFSLCCEYINLAYGRVAVIYRNRVKELGLTRAPPPTTTNTTNITTSLTTTTTSYTPHHYFRIRIELRSFTLLPCSCSMLWLIPTSRARSSYYYYAHYYDYIYYYYFLHPI